MCLLGGAVTRITVAAPPGVTLVAQLQERFGFTEAQAKGALGALLVFAREQLPKPEFDSLAQRIPNADRIMQQVVLQGIVTSPLDDIEEYETTLSQLGIGQPLASQVAPAVLEYLSAAGFTKERDILAQIVD